MKGFNHSNRLLKKALPELRGLKIIRIITTGLFLVALASFSALADNVELTKDFESLNIGTYLEILEDKDKTFSIDDILSNVNPGDTKWVQSSGNAVGFGFTNSVYWTRFTVRNNTDRSFTWLLNQEYPLIDSIQIYLVPPDGAIKKLSLGDKLPFHQRPIIDKTFVVPVETAPYANTDVYARFQTSSSMNIALKIWSRDSFEASKRTELPLLWMFYGIFIVMFAINLIILVYTREVAFVFYVTYIATFTLLMMSLSGIAFQYLWPDAIWWENLANALLISIVIFSLIQFARHMIETKRHSRSIDTTLKAFSVLSVLIIVVTLVTNNYRLGIIAATALTGFCATFGFCSSALLAFGEKYKIREAQIFFYAFSCFFIGIFLFVLKTFSVLPINFITTYAIQIGASVQIILLTLILPDRLNILRKKLTILNESLEDQVTERTAELEVTQEKLLKTAHKAGMADMARDTMHSIGNIVNSMNISIERLEQADESGSISAFKKANELLRANFDNLGEFILKDPKGKKLMEFYLEIENSLNDDQDAIKSSIVSISNKIKEIINVIAAQQEYVDEAYFMEVSNLAELIDEVLVALNPDIEKYLIAVETDFHEVPKILIQTRKLNFIFTSLISNAIQAMSLKAIKKKKMLLSLYPRNGNVCFSIQDTGVGIPPNELKKIFRHGYSYHQIGKGLGLHSCGNYVSEMNGKIWAESEGENMGATFYIELPINHE